MNKIILLIAILFISCKNESTQKFNSHRLVNTNDTLTIEYTGRGDVVHFKMFEGLHLNLSKDGQNRFVSKLEIPNLDSAIFTYNIIIQEMDSLKKMHEVAYEPRETDDFIWIGKHRQDTYIKSQNYMPYISTDTIQSEYLNEPREVTIYRNNSKGNKESIIYLTDGFVVNAYAPYVHKLIEENIIEPITLIGVHSSFSNRYKEYVADGDEEIFTNHKDFFFKEILEQYETELMVKNRYIYGFSNGAAFAMYCGINYADHFKDVIAFSTADYISEYSKSIEFKHDNYPYFYLGAGKYEESIYRDNLDFLNKMKSNNLKVEFKSFISGHDYNVWRIEFLKYLETEFRK